jgi:membrane protease YdiL (CAAX protease family)
MNGEEPPTHQKGPWGPIATVAFTVLIALVLVVVQTVLAIPYLALQAAAHPMMDFAAAASGLQSDGLFVGLSELVGGAVALGLTVLIAWARKGPPLRDYLALWPVGRLTMLRWLLCTTLIAVLLDGLSYLFGYAIVPDWMIHIYRSAVFLPQLLLALLVVAPVLEEVVFRGFWFEGLRRSRLGEVGAIVLGSLVWASVHLQYEWFYVGQVFVVGLLLGAARVRTRSLVTPTVMHALFSGIALLQTAVRA